MQTIFDIIGLNKVACFSKPQPKFSHRRDTKQSKINKFRFCIQYLRVRNFQTHQFRTIFSYSNSG